MREADHERAAAIIARQFADQSPSVSPGDYDWLRAHRERCAACARAYEDALLAARGRDGAPADALLTDREQKMLHDLLVERTREDLARQAATSPPARPFRAVVMGGAFAAMATAAAVLLFARSEPPAPVDGPTAPRGPGVTGTRWGKPTKTALGLLCAHPGAAQPIRLDRTKPRCATGGTVTPLLTNVGAFHHAHILLVDGSLTEVGPRDKLEITAAPTHGKAVTVAPPGLGPRAMLAVFSKEPLADSAIDALLKAFAGAGISLAKLNGPLAFQAPSLPEHEVHGFLLSGGDDRAR